MSKIVIGLTGSFGSGCSKMAEEYIKPLEYRTTSLSRHLRALYRRQIGDDNPPRSSLQAFGTQIRGSERGADFLADQVIKEIEDNPNEEKWVIDSIRNPAEVQAFRRVFPEFFLIGVFAEKDTRWNRVKDKYKNDQTAFNNDDETDRDERDTDGEPIEHGQKVAACFLSADLVIANTEDFLPGSKAEKAMQAQIKRYVGGIENPFSISPSEEEAVMAVAYATSQRSSCLKRKVGAVIVDRDGNLFSAGYNEVPQSTVPCVEQGGCQRDRLKAKISDGILSVVKDPQTTERILRTIAGDIRALDRCSALHAEENAILNIAKFGSSVAIRGAKLYTTTYPCNMCANKIVQVGIGEIVYFEPYPDEEAYKVLKQAEVIRNPFHGVTFRGYFRVFGGGVGGEALSKVSQCRQL